MDCSLLCPVVPFARSAFPYWPHRQTPAYPSGANSKAASFRKPSLQLVTPALWFRTFLSPWSWNSSRAVPGLTQGASKEPAQQTYAGVLSLCPPLLPGQGRPHPWIFLCELHFPFLLFFSLLLPLLPANLSVSSPYSFFLLLPSPRDLPSAPRPLSPSSRAPRLRLRARSCSSRGGLQRRCHARWAASPRLLLRGQVGGSGLEAAAVDLQVGVGARGASFPDRGPSFGAGLGGPGRAPPAPGAPIPPPGSGAPRAGGAHSPRRGSDDQAQGDFGGWDPLGLLQGQAAGKRRALLTLFGLGVTSALGNLNENGGSAPWRGLGAGGRMAFTQTRKRLGRIPTPTSSRRDALGVCGMGLSQAPPPPTPFSGRRALPSS